LSGGEGLRRPIKRRETSEREFLRGKGVLELTCEKESSFLHTHGKPKKMRES